MTRAQLGSIQRFDKDRYRISIEDGRNDDGRVLEQWHSDW